MLGALVRACGANFTPMHVASVSAQGKFTFGQDDEMCVKVQMTTIPRSAARATAQLQESISFKAKGIDGDYSATGTYGVEGQ